MPTALQQALPYILIPVVTITAAGFLTSVYRPGPQSRNYIQHFAAGMVFAAVAAELVPPMKELSVVHVLVGLVMGVLVMLGIKWITEEKLHGRLGHAGRNGATINLGLVITVIVDMFVDGLLIGLGFALGTGTGVLLTIALATEGFFLSLTLALELAEAGASRLKTLAATAGLGVALAIGAVLGLVFLGSAGNLALALVLSFGAAALLYLVTEELLVESAYEHGEKYETPLTVAAFFVGFILILGTAMASGH